MDHTTKAKIYYKVCLDQYIQAERRRCMEVDALVQAQNWSGLKLLDKLVDDLQARKNEAYAIFMYFCRNGDDCECNGINSTCSACRGRNELDELFIQMEDESYDR